VGRLRSTGRVPPILAVALIGAVVGLLVGFGLGYRLGSVAPAPAATPASFVPGDIQADAVSSRLEEAFQSAAAGGGAAVCRLDREVVCQQLVVGTTEPRVPPSEYGLGWYGNRELTRVVVQRARLVVAAAMNEGAASAWLHRMGPGDAFLETIDLTPVNPNRAGTFYFDLGVLAPGHYVVEIDFVAVPAVEGSPGLVRTYVVGFVVG
jgi:hypothetical protein